MTTPFVYAITDGEFIKIGVSVNPNKRLKQLSTGSAKRLVLLGYFNGGYTLETELHESHIKVRNNGEWMKPTNDLLNYLNDMIPNKHIALVCGKVLSYPKIPVRN